MCLTGTVRLTFQRPKRRHWLSSHTVNPVATADTVDWHGWSSSHNWHSWQEVLLVPLCGRNEKVLICVPLRLSLPRSVLLLLHSCNQKKLYQIGAPFFLTIQWFCMQIEENWITHYGRSWHSYGSFTKSLLWMAFSGTSIYFHHVFSLYVFI